MRKCDVVFEGAPATRHRLLVGCAIGDGHGVAVGSFRQDDHIAAIVVAPLDFYGVA